ncbi:MAG: flagellar protein FlgN [Thermodesulfobacteriota bacterium]|nr:flagellar protein FlgN [Thermodesulfobacteriota bacterium]
MDLLLNDFLGLLEGETGVYRSLLLVLQKEKTAVVEAKLKDLNEASKEKESLVLKIRILEEQRTRSLERLADSLGCPSFGLTLSKISQLVEEPYSTRLRKCQSNLTALIQSIREVNQSNRSLLTHSLELVRSSLTLLDNLMAYNPVYYRTGKFQMNDQSGKVLSGRI